MPLFDKTKYVTACKIRIYFLPLPLQLNLHNILTMIKRWHLDAYYKSIFYKYIFRCACLDHYKHYNVLKVLPGVAAPFFLEENILVPFSCYLLVIFNHNLSPRITGGNKICLSNEKGNLTHLDN